MELLGSIISSVAGSVASSLFGGGDRKRAPATPRFSRQQAPFSANVPNVIDTRTSTEPLPDVSAQAGSLRLLTEKHKAIMDSLIDVDKTA
jgi:hypothetical protein